MRYFRLFEPALPANIEIHPPRTMSHNTKRHQIAKPKVQAWHDFEIHTPYSCQESNRHEDHRQNSEPPQPIRFVLTVSFKG